jgi:hypothetical protein
VATASTKPRKLVTVGPLRVRKIPEEDSRVGSGFAGWATAGVALFALVGYVAFQKHQKDNQIEPEIL